MGILGNYFFDKESPILPANLNLLGALPARFRKPRVLIVGCGDVGTRVLALLQPRVRVVALTSQPHRIATLRALGATPLLGNLDEPATLRRLSGLAQRVLHLAPPPAHNPRQWHDPRTRALLRSLHRRSLPRALVYGSTSGVYGDCAGTWVNETRAVQPQTARAQRRVDAEQQLRRWSRASGVRSSVLRIPGIYAPNREGGTPRARLLQGTPALQAQEDVFTNHIHADDLARACVAALWRGKPQRRYHVSDDSDVKMGDYLDMAADLYGLPRPPRISRIEARAQVSATRLSFMEESRRLVNTRMKKELRVALRYPTVREGLA